MIDFFKFMRENARINGIYIWTFPQFKNEYYYIKTSYLDGYFIGADSDDILPCSVSFKETTPEAGTLLDYYDEEISFNETLTELIK